VIIVKIIRYTIQKGRPNTKGSDFSHHQKSSDKKKRPMKTRYQTTFVFFGNQNGIVIEYFPPMKYF